MRYVAGCYKPLLRLAVALRGAATEVSIVDAGIARITVRDETPAYAIAIVQRWGPAPPSISGHQSSTDFVVLLRANSSVCSSA